MKSGLLTLEGLNAILSQNKIMIALFVKYLETLGFPVDKFEKEFEEDFETIEEVHKAIFDRVFSDRLENQI